MRSVMLLLASFACLMILAAPATAQRDPFDPVIDPNAATTTTTGTTTTGGTTGETTGVQPVVGSEGLANTGSDVGPYLVIAYGLLVVGAGALYLSKLHAPRPVRR